MDQRIPMFFFGGGDKLVSESNVKWDFEKRVKKKIKKRFFAKH